MRKKIDQSIKEVLKNHPLENDEKVLGFEIALKNFDDLIDQGFTTRRGNNLISIDERYRYLNCENQYKR